MAANPKCDSPTAAFLIGAALFTALTAATTAVMWSAALDGVALRQVTLKSAMVSLAAAMMDLNDQAQPLASLQAVCSSAPFTWPLHFRN